VPIVAATGCCNCWRSGYSIEATAVRAVQCTVYSPCKTLSLFCGFR